jgi:glutamine synthetase
VKPKAILAYCREKGIRTIDLRFTDLDGKWQHTTLPSTSLTEASFEEGFGQEVALDRGSPEYPFSIVVPLSEANYLDSTTEPPTLVLVSSIQDFFHRQEVPLDTRHVAVQSLRFLESTSIADEVYVRSHIRFGLASTIDSSSDPLFDDGFAFRCQLMNQSIDAGVNVERHLLHPSGSSEIVLQPSKLLEACDDISMTKSMMSHLASSTGRKLQFVDQWSTSQWKWMRGGSSLFAGNSARGVSDIGRYAQGGIARHSASLSAIFLLSSLGKQLTPYPYMKNSACEGPQSLTRSVQDSQALRSRALEVRGTPTLSNHYLSYAAIIMAMIDGILNKWNPPTGNEPMEPILERTAEGSIRFDRLLEDFNNDWDFLTMGSVFGEELIEAIRGRIQAAASR